MVKHNYRVKLEKMLTAGEIPLIPGGGTYITVAHDDDCPALRGGTCRCDPDIIIRGVELPITASKN